MSIMSSLAGIRGGVGSGSAGGSGNSSYVDTFMNAADNNTTDQDANALLTELDKGLRSPRIGEQCEAIVRFPKLFEKYPFPILINSSFLKLAEFFRFGSNLLRLWVLRVCQQSEKHLDKILNVDEFLKRIFTVMHSNDPIARALTLRTLGAIAGVIPEKQQVHHVIRKSLDSHDAVEVEAAIQASVQFAAQSRTFAISMCAKMAAMIESLQIPIGQKLQVIPVLRHMHHDATTAALVKRLCRALLPKYPSESFVCVILDSLTQLSMRTLVDIPDQVGLLLSYLADPRRRIRYNVLRSMQQLARGGAHLWPKAALQGLITSAMACNDEGNEQSLVLAVVRTLTECPVTCNALLADEQQRLLDLCAQCLVLEHHTAASQAVRILCGIVCYCQLERVAAPPAYQQLIDLHLESLVYCTLSSDEHHRELSCYMVSGVRLAERNVEFAERFVQLVGGCLADDFVYPPKNTITLTETLGAICSQFLCRRFAGPVSTTPAIPTRRISSATVSVSTALPHGGAAQPMDIDCPQPPPHLMHSLSHPSLSTASATLHPASSPDAFQLLLPQLLRRLDQLVDATTTTAHPAGGDDVRQTEVLAAVCLQALLGCALPARTRDTFERLAQRADLWTLYRIARSASRYGQHYLAARIYARLAGRVCVEKLHFYLGSLVHISQAECLLVYGYEYAQIEQNYALVAAATTTGANAATVATAPFSLAERLERATALYLKALATLKASSTPAHPLHFHTEFVALRAQLLDALHGCTVIKNTQHIAPPPAIAHTLAQNSRDYLQKFGHCTNQLRKAVKALKHCEDAYGRLYRSVFDADPGTLEFLEAARSACTVLGHTLESICFASPSDLPPSCAAESSQHPEIAYANAQCQRMRRELAALPQPEPGVQKAITARHTEVMVRQIETLLRGPLCVPRFYFQQLQSTGIKLSVSPQPRVAGDPVVVQPGSVLVVKVEGVVQTGGGAAAAGRRFRTIESVQLTLTAQLASAAAAATLRPLGGEYKTPADGGATTVLTQTVRPHRDFLSGSFLVPLSANGGGGGVAGGGCGGNGGGNGGSSGGGAGLWQITLEACVVDGNSVLWNTGPKSTLSVRVPEDMNQNANAGGSSRRY